MCSQGLIKLSTISYGSTLAGPYLCAVPTKLLPALLSRPSPHCATRRRSDVSGHVAQEEPFLSGGSLGSVTQQVVRIAFRGIYTETTSHLQILDNRIAAQDANRDTVLHHGQLIYIATGH